LGLTKGRKMLTPPIDLAASVTGSPPGFGFNGVPGNSFSGASLNVQFRAVPFF
jgi:hypothetical protein